MPHRSMALLSAALLGLAAAGQAGAADGRASAATDAGATAAPRTTRVLFVGNSHTATHRLPEVVAALAQRQGVALEVGMLAEPGHSLGDHLAGGRLQAALQRADWDWVVLQQGPSSRPESRVDLRRSVTAIADVLHGRRARVALMSVWPHRRDRASSPAAEESYRQAAAAIGACVLPVATAWRLAGPAEGAPRLYQRDQLHATQAGTVLAALTVGLGLVGPDDTAPPPSAGDTMPSDAVDELQVLRQLAARAHRDEPRRCKDAAAGTPATAAIDPDTRP